MAYTFNGISVLSRRNNLKQMDRPVLAAIRVWSVSTKTCGSCNDFYLRSGFCEAFQQRWEQPCWVLVESSSSAACCHAGAVRTTLVWKYFLVNSGDSSTEKGVGSAARSQKRAEDCCLSPVPSPRDTLTSSFLRLLGKTSLHPNNSGVLISYGRLFLSWPACLASPLRFCLLQLPGLDKPSSNSLFFCTLFSHPSQQQDLGKLLCDCTEAYLLSALKENLVFGRWEGRGWKEEQVLFHTMMCTCVFCLLPYSKLFHFTPFPSP